jgi:branched-subunit amino acid aminotransferase/4-amino-4-deoxychorismate lyase
MRNSVVWVNGRLVPAARAAVPVSDRGLLYGDGIFETIRVYAGEPYLLADHLRRLRRSGRALGIPIPGDVASWRRVVLRVLRANRLRDAVVRLTVTRGRASGLAPSTRGRPTLILQARPVDRILPIARARGVALCLLDFPRAPDAFAVHKTLAYLPAVLGRLHAQRRGFADGLHVREDGAVTEATTANVFMCLGRRLRTPDTGVLPGITRRVVMEIARGLGFEIEEGRVTRGRLSSAAEVFLTSSVAEIVPVIRIEQRAIGAGIPGPVTRAIQHAYATRIARMLARAARRPSTTRVGSRAR